MSDVSSRLLEIPFNVAALRGPGLGVSGIRGVGRFAASVGETMSTNGAMAADAGRIGSMDQFRGYTVAGMLVVNFLGGLEAVPAVLKHNNTFFSYADTIMPSFLFAAGFSYRLTTLRRLPKLGRGATARRSIGRSFGLVLVSLAMY